jgi:hypothetical protein
MDEMTLPESAQALVAFRSELLKILAEIQVQVFAVELACKEKQPVTQSRFLDLKDQAEKKRERLHERLAERLPLAHEVRD